jgi:hypothetical protein
MSTVFSLRSSCLAVAPLVPHDMTPPPAFAPITLPHGEIVFLPLRYSYMFAKVSPNVEYEGWGFGAIQLGHDMGFLIPHSPSGPPTPILAAHITFSKCQTMFGKATVMINGAQAGWWQIYALFQICANPAPGVGVPIPLGFNVSAIWTTIKYGFSWGDLVCGYIRIGIDSLLSFLVGAFFRNARVAPIHQAWSLRMADRLYPRLGPIVARIGVGRFTIGFFNYAVIERVIRRAPQEIKRFVISPIVGNIVKDPLRDLSLAIDQALGDAPAPAPSPAPTTGLTDSVPMLE